MPDVPESSRPVRPAGRQTPAVSVIVAVHNAEATLGRTLDALTQQDIEVPYEVIVVDDGSTDSSGAMAEAAGEPVIAVRRERRGPGAARNDGAAMASGPVLAFTDPDCVPEPGWLRSGLEGIEGREVLQGEVRADGSARIGPFDRTLWVLSDRGLYQTANLFMRRETFERCGGFDEWVDADAHERGPFGEDVELVWRARRGGARVGFSSSAAVEHAVFPRAARDYVEERRRLALFPELARRVPELRRELFFARIFHTSRSAAFDLAIVSLALAPLVGPRRTLPGVVPYAFLIWRHVSRRRGRRLRRGAVEVCADSVGLVSLLEGSLRARRPLM